MGLNFYTGFIAEKNNDLPENLFKHVAHFLELGGENTLCIGSDFDGAEVPGYVKDVSFIPSFYQKMVDFGLDKQTADKIFYKNAKKFFEENLTK